MKVSLICTVWNEEKNIRELLNSINVQILQPDEFIIVDGGSNDDTINILKEYKKRHHTLKIIETRKCNIPQGRNLAIKKAKYDIIVGVDAGTKYDKNWLKNLTKNFKGDVGFGKTLPLIKNDFQKVLAKKMKQRFGSSRNIIFKKDVWKKVGKYPEDLDMAEDTVFTKKVKDKRFKINFIPNAIGYWEMRDNIGDLEKQFYNYGYWDAIAYKKYRVLPLKRKIALFILTILFIFFPLFWIVSKFSLSIKIDFVRRFAYLKGFWTGVLKK